MKPKPRWMQSVIAAAKEAGDAPLAVSARKRGKAAEANKATCA